MSWWRLLGPGWWFGRTYKGPQFGQPHSWFFWIENWILFDIDLPTSMNFIDQVYSIVFKETFQICGNQFDLCVHINFNLDSFDGSGLDRRITVDLSWLVGPRIKGDQKIGSWYCVVISIEAHEGSIVRGSWVHNGALTVVDWYSLTDWVNRFIAAHDEADQEHQDGQTE